MALNTLFFIAIMVLFNFWIDNQVHGEEISNEVPRTENHNTCTSAKCNNESMFYLDNMDHNIDPCEDFFSFTCGGFLKNAVIPENDFHVSQYGRLNKKIRNELINELKKEPQQNQLEAYGKIKNFYANCINETRIEKDGITRIKEFLDRLGGWPVLYGNKWKEDNYQWEKTVSFISEMGLKPDFPFTIDIVYDKNSKKYITNVRAPMLDVDNNYTGNDTNSQHYINYMTDIAVLLGANNETAFNDMQECLKFELKLFKAIYSIDEATIDLISPKKRSIKFWTTEFREISWLKLFNQIFNPSNVTLTESDILFIHESQYVSKLGKLLNETAKRTIANHQLWRVLSHYIIRFTPKEFRQRQEKFKELISEKQKSLGREDECLDILQQHSPIALNSLYVHKYVNKFVKPDLLFILKNVKNETRKHFKKLQWIDDYMQEVVLRKLETMTVLVAYPDELIDDIKVENVYKDLNINLESPLYSYLNITKMEKDFLIKMLRSTREEVHWTKITNVAKVTANYDSENHHINIAAGILQSPFFDLDRPSYLNYGGIGFAIGHEIIHGIDTSQYDPGKNDTITLKNSTIEKYEKRANCIIDQFSNYTIDGVYGNVDGDLTYTENIADGGGFKLGYYAYNNWVKSRNIVEPLLPGLNYTPQQMYWISAASNLCSKIKDVPLPTYLRRDVHSPDEARINVGFSNIEEFARDFDCPLGSRMNPARKCIVW